MSLNDPIADMLTRIRNANRAKHKDVDMPASKMKIAIAKILKDEGYIDQYAVVSSEPADLLRMRLKYTKEGESVFQSIQRVSNSGRRIYCDRQSIPHVLRGLGVAILSTSQGILSDKECRKRHIGGEVLCEVW